MKKFENKIAVITGGNSGMGYGTAKVLKEMGATVVITGRRTEAVELAAKQLNVNAIVSDQGKLEDIDNLVAEVIKKFGKVDILYINAGISGTSSIEKETPENFDKMNAINYRGVFFTLSKFIPHLNDGASVVILSSVLASTVSPGLGVYSASKASTQPSNLLPKGCLWHNPPTPNHILTIYLPYTYHLPTPYLTAIFCWLKKLCMW